MPRFVKLKPTLVCVQDNSGELSFEEFRRAVRKDAGMQASLMPIVLIEHTEHPKEWRGVIAPEARGGPAVERWFRSYTDFLLAHAVLAQQASPCRPSR